MKAIRYVVFALVAVTGFALATPDANAGHKQQRRVEKHPNWKRGHRPQPQYRVVYKWVWNSYYRQWEWKGVYEPVGYTYDRYERHDHHEHDHPFPEDDGHTCY